MLIRPLKDMKKVLHTVRNQGVLRAAELIAETIADRLHQRFDLKHGVETAEYVSLSRLGFDLEEQRLNRDYAASPVRTVRALLSRLPRDLGSFTFIDFGSGKGRVLLVASEFSFRRIIGVEFSKDLHRIAESNLKVYKGRKQRCFALSSVCVRAEEFLLPDGDLVLYFFNPFEPEIMERVLTKATIAWQQRSCTVYLLFFRMRFRAIVERLGIFRELPVRRLPFDPGRPFDYSGYDVAIFVADPKR